MEATYWTEKYNENKRDMETYHVIGAAMEVHKILGPGLLEAAYGDALEIELRRRAIPFEREKMLPIHYKDEVLTTKYYADFLCYGSVVVELKAVEAILNIHKAQLIHYLNITHLKKGLLLNFKSLRLDYHRYIL
jgi:GxxExxY protein